MNRLKGVQKAEVRPSTGSVIVLYDPKKISTQHLIDSLSSNLQRTLRRCAEEGGKKGPGQLQARHKSSWKTSLTYHLVNATALSAFMAYALIRKFLFKSPVPQTPFSITGIVATLGAVPLLKKAWADFRQGKRLGLFPFLTAACGLAVAAGEALTALEIIWVLGVGMLLETYATDRAGRAIREILRVAPDKTIVLRNGMEVETSTDEVRPGEMVVVRTGRKISVDGTVREGEALVDEAHISGRSQPELRGSGDHVYAGTMVRQGTIRVKAEKVGDETYLCRIVDLVEDSLASRTEAEKKADILAARLTRIGVASTAGTFLLTGSAGRAFSVMLVMACPCATVLAASTAVSAAIANAAGRQIFIKGGLYLERASDIDTVCFDKTGTITTGAAGVTKVSPRDGRQDPGKLLAVAAGAESKSQHPIAKALLEETRVRGIVPENMTDFRETIGLGIRARSGSHTVSVGNQRFMQSHGIVIGPIKNKASKYFETGHTVVYVAVEDRLEGFIALTNNLRKGAGTVLKKLRHRGIRRFLLISGDTEPIVKTISQKLGFDDYKAPLLPEEKAWYIERLIADNRQVLMVGDGVNDSLALSKATIGIAMGAGGSEVAVETADIALAGDDLEGLVTLRLLSHQTLRIIEQNFWMANATNFAGILLGASGWMPPVMAGALHIAHTLGIMLNSGRLMYWEPVG